MASTSAVDIDETVARLIGDCIRLGCQCPTLRDATKECVVVSMDKGI